MIFDILLVGGAALYLLGFIMGKGKNTLGSVGAIMMVAAGLIYGLQYVGIDVLSMLPSF